MVDRLLEFFPPQHRTAEAFNKHFTVGTVRLVAFTLVTIQVAR